MSYGVFSSARRLKVRAAVENMMSNACQLLLMRACARRAYCKKCHSRFFGRMFNDFNEFSTFFCG
jgi:hypothetical protein